jgi:cyclopropane fatty-acyl-phospholipid synthase-like methyltransferase
MNSTTFSNQDVERYYDQTEVHYRMFWKLDHSMGLHYGLWDPNTPNLQEAILNTNRWLAQLADIKKEHLILDAGCGIGGSSIFLAQTYNCSVQGITLSRKQVQSARNYAKQKGLDEQVQFDWKDYTQTGYPDQAYDGIWCIESIQTAPLKEAFFKEAHRILKPGAYLLVGDIFKPHSYPIDEAPHMKQCLNGWAMSDFLDLESFSRMASTHGFKQEKHRNVNREVWPSVWRLYVASMAGFVGTKAYNFFRKASFFSRIHYKTGLSQYKAYRKKQWEYHLLCFRKV